jgi:hypothetical protein
MTLSARIDGRRVRFEAGGPWNLADVFALIERAREEAGAAGLGRILIDMRRVTGPIPEMERFFAGERVAAVASGSPSWPGRKTSTGSERASPRTAARAFACCAPRKRPSAGSRTDRRGRSRPVGLAFLRV